MNIKEVNDRGVLSEGRNNGMGFAFLEKVGEEYHTAHALSPCKDYLNDVVFTENTGHPLTACGLSYSKRNIFDGTSHMAIKIVKSKGNSYSYSKDIEADKKLLRDNHKNIQTLINYFEEVLGLSSRTIIEERNDDYFYLNLPLEWTKSSYAISLFSLILRVGMVYDGEKDIMEFLEAYTYNEGDLNLMKSALPKIKTILETKTLPEQSAYNEEAVIKKQWTPHSLGILSWKP